MSLVMTGVAPYDTLNNAAPVAQAFSHIGLKWKNETDAMDILDWVYGQRLVSPLWMRHLYWLFWGKSILSNVKRIQPS